MTSQRDLRFIAALWIRTEQLTVAVQAVSPSFHRSAAAYAKTSHFWRGRLAHAPQSILPIAPAVSAIEPGYLAGRIPSRCAERLKSGIVGTRSGPARICEGSSRSPQPRQARQHVSPLHIPVRFSSLMISSSPTTRTKTFSSSSRAMPAGRRKPAGPSKSTPRSSPAPMQKRRATLTTTKASQRRPRAPQPGQRLRRSQIARASPNPTTTPPI